MKKVLFATTALALSAGVASAQGIELTGGAIFGLKDDGTAGGDVFLHGEADFNIVASGTTDNGLSFGASMDIDGNFVGTEDPDDFEAFVSGAFGTVTVGDVAPATDGIGLADVGFDGIGLDDDLEAIRDAGGADVNYAYDVAGFSILLSYGVGTTSGADADEGDFGIAVGYSFDGFSVDAGYVRDNTDLAERDAYAIRAAYTFDAITVGAMYAAAEEDGVDSNGYGIDVSYTFDAFTITAVYNDTDTPAVAADTDADYGIGGTYDLGGGLSLAGGVGSVNGNSVWDLGVVMSF